MLSVRQLGLTIRDLVTRYPLTLVFLLAYIAYNDGVQTVDLLLGHLRRPGAAPRRDHPHRRASSMVQFVAFFGAILLGRVAVRVGTRKTVLWSLVAWCGVVAAAYFVPPEQPLLFFALGFAIAIVMGGTQALSRSLFSHVIPKGGKRSITASTRSATRVRRSSDPSPWAWPCS